jgi:hypothetical protein
VQANGAVLMDDFIAASATAQSAWSLAALQVLLLGGRLTGTVIVRSARWLALGRALCSAAKSHGDEGAAKPNSPTWRAGVNQLNYDFDDRKESKAGPSLSFQFVYSQSLFENIRSSQPYLVRPVRAA